MDEILDWIFADSRREFLVQSIFCVGGVLAVVYGLILQLKSKLRHEVLPREFAGSVIAVRSRRWGYVLLLLVEFFLAGALIPACATL